MLSINPSYFLYSSAKKSKQTDLSTLNNLDIIIMFKDYIIISYNFNLTKVNKNSNKSFLQWLGNTTGEQVYSIVRE